MFFNYNNRNNKRKNINGENNHPSVSQEVYTKVKLEGIKISNSLIENIDIINKIVGDNTDLVTRNFTLGRKKLLSAVLFYFDNLVDSKHIDLNIIQPLLTDSYTSGLITASEIIKEIQLGNLISRAELAKAKDMKALVDGLLEGDAVLLIEGVEEAYVMSAKGYDYRSVGISEVEPVVSGPKDAFIEGLSVNLSLIRRRIHSPNLVFKSLKVGRETQTTVCVAYIKGICSIKLITEVFSRISKIDIDGILGSNYIEEFINDEPFSIFPQIRNTERPDVASAALLEGRIVIIVDNTPMALIIPGEFFSLFHAADDYYNRFWFSSVIRLFRYLAAFIALTLPSFYIALANFHQELIPTNLLVSIISARTGVPLPNFVEAFLMEGTFEILREAGVRLPRPVGQAVSIVGGLVIGQAAVQASIVSPLMVIVVSLTAIASFCVPQYNISHPIRLLRFPLMILAATLGIYGLMLGLLFLLLHLCSIRSFGVPYFAPFAPLKLSDLKDTIIRAPLWANIKRPTETTHNKNRIVPNQTPRPPKK
jgi:spore germination protein KA